MERILSNSTIIRKQAEYSAAAWYKRIKSCLKEDGIILLMGKNARKLIENTYRTGENRFEAGLNSRRDHTTLLDTIEEHFRLYNVIHASGIAYRRNRERWLKTGNVRSTSGIFSTEYPEHVQTISWEELFSPTSAQSRPRLMHLPRPAGLGTVEPRWAFGGAAHAGRHAAAGRSSMIEQWK